LLELRRTALQTHLPAPVLTFVVAQALLCDSIACDC
jgi:hypothetical protein